MVGNGTEDGYTRKFDWLVLVHAAKLFVMHDPFYVGSEVCDGPDKCQDVIVALQKRSVLDIDLPSTPFFFVIERGMAVQNLRLDYPKGLT